MKHSAKKLSVILLSLVCVMCLAVALVACSDKNENPSALSAPVIEIDENGVISWAEVNHATGYTIQENGEDVATVQELSYQITQTVPGTYSYTVTAVGDGKNYVNSKPSEPKSFTVATAIKLAKPTLSLDINVLSWEAVENASSYDVYEGGIVVSNTAQTQYTIPSKEIGSYSYTVVAKGDGKKYSNSDPSDAAVFTVGKLATPSKFSLDENYKPAPRITWMEVADAAGYSVTLTYNGVKGETETVQSASYGIGETYGNYLISVIALAKTDDPLHKDSEAGMANFTYANPEAADLTKPSVEKREDGYTLVWDQVENASSYNVYMGGEFVASVPTTALIDISTEPSQKQMKVFYEAVPKDFESVGQSVSYTVAAVGDGTEFKDSQQSDGIDVFRFGTPSVNVNNNGILSWDPSSDGYAFADIYEIYCNGELVTTVNNQESYPIDQDEPGYYLYYIIAKDSKGKHMPSFASSKVIYNYMDPLSPSAPVTFAIKQYQEIIINLDYSVDVKQWYDFELKIVGSSLDELSKLIDFQIDIWGASTVYTEEENKELWGPIYADNVEATDGVFKASVIPLDERMIKVQISSMDDDLNADYVVLQISMKKNDDLELPETFPGEKADGELSVEGVMGVSDSADLWEDCSTVTVHNLKGFEHIALPLDIVGSTSKPLVPGKKYQLQIMNVFGFDYQISDFTNIGYAFDESAFDNESYNTMRVLYGFELLCDFTLEENVDKIYILNLDEGTNAHLICRIIESDGEGGEGGGEEDTPILGVGEDAAIRVDIIQYESTFINLSEGVYGDFTITLSSNDFEPGYEIALNIGFEEIMLTSENNYTAKISIPEGTVDISLVGVNCSAYFTLVTLTREG